MEPRELSTWLKQPACMRGICKMINSVGRDIPDQVLKDTGMKVFQGSRARNAEEYVKAAPKVRAWIDPTESKMVADIHEALVKCGIKDGMTLGFHHHFRNGDHTTTLMRTRLGKTILLQHNVVDPHEYTRRYHVVGTLKSVESSDSTPHDQMSRRMDRRLVHSLHQGLPLDIDVYDLAEWCAVSELSRLSIENGNVPVAFPDFTRAKIW